MDNPEILVPWGLWEVVEDTPAGLFLLPEGLRELGFMLSMVESQFPNTSGLSHTGRQSRLPGPEGPAGAEVVKPW